MNKIADVKIVNSQIIFVNHDVEDGIRFLNSCGPIVVANDDVSVIASKWRDVAKSMEDNIKQLHNDGYTLYSSTGGAGGIIMVFVKYED
jgi:hypothetical protein